MAGVGSRVVLPFSRLVSPGTIHKAIEDACASHPMVEHWIRSVGTSFKLGCPHLLVSLVRLNLMEHEQHDRYKCFDNAVALGR